MEPTIQERTATLNIIRKIGSIRNRISDDTEDAGQVIAALDDTINDINRTLFPGNAISEIYGFNIKKDGKEEFEREFEKWKAYMEKVLAKTARCKNKTEADFEILMVYLEVVKQEELEQVLKDNLVAFKNEKLRLYNVLIGIYNMYANFWGALNPEKGDFDCIHQRTEALKEHIEEWRWLFAELCDNRSKKGTL